MVFFFKKMLFSRAKIIYFDPGRYNFVIKFSLMKKIKQMFNKHKAFFSSAKP